jgi:hypothetical protein
LIQINNIDDLKHRINENIKAIENQVKNSAGFVDPKLADENTGLYDQYLTDEKIINDIRQDFNRFASKWM